MKTQVDGIEPRLGTRRHAAGSPQPDSRRPAAVRACLLWMGVGLLPLVSTTLAGGTRPRSPAELGRSFEYDLTPFRRTEPSLILYSEIQSVSLPVREPRGLAIGPADRLYVVGDRTLLEYDRDGNLLATETLSSDPRCVAVSEAGVYVGMHRHIEVRRGGTWQAWPALGERAVLTSIAVGWNEVWAADAGQRRVWRFGLDGSPRGTIPTGDSPGERFIVPSPHLDVAFGPDGSLWVTDPGRRRIRRYGDGRLLQVWGESGMAIEAFCGCCNPTDLAIGGDGTVFTSEKGLPRIKQYSPDGRFLGVVAGPESFEEDAAGLDLAIDSGGRVWVLDARSRTARVWVRKETLP